MSWVTIIWAMIASACLTLAMMHLIIWVQQTWRRAHLLFSVTAISVAAIVACELLLMRAQTTEQFGTVMRWAHVPLFFTVVSIVGFVRLYLRAGRPWLGYTVCGVRLLVLIINFLSVPNVNYKEITGLRHLTTLGGETISIAEGVRNPWVKLDELSVLLLLVFAADASVTLWRRGDRSERRRALVVGGSTTFFILAAAGHATLVNEGFIQSPYLIGLSFLAIVAAMGYELSQDVLRAARLSDDLRESQQRMALATHAAKLGIWVRDLVRNEVWATDEWRALLGFGKSERIDLNGFLQKLHPEDREAVSQTLAKAFGGDGGYEMEYRVVLPNGRIRWIASRGGVELDANGKPVLMRGASLDITTRKQAEEAAHNLSGRLIQAQEEEQMRLARDLHDDLSQSLALLSIELEMFGQSRPAERDQMKAFSAQVKRLSLEVHRLSHELHPTTLEQLGLVAALRGFCEEFGLAHKLAIEFTDRSVPQAVPQDTALCLYRIAQEALHNVAKHSRATATRVDLVKDDGELRLTIDDDGVGFDPKATRANASLGLVSMSERARFVHGRLSVESHAGKGTRVEVHVPMSSADELC
jgi:two-component system, LuxR family, sensor kinase FixL